VVDGEVAAGLQEVGDASDGSSKSHGSSFPGRCQRAEKNRAREERGRLGLAFW
jgi:hypothetical protein